MPKMLTLLIGVVRGGNHSPGHAGPVRLHRVAEMGGKDIERAQVVFVVCHLLVDLAARLPHVVWVFDDDDQFDETLSLSRQERVS